MLVIFKIIPIKYIRKETKNQTKKLKNSKLFYLNPYKIRLMIDDKNKVLKYSKTKSILINSNNM